MNIDLTKSSGESTIEATDSKASSANSDPNNNNSNNNNPSPPKGKDHHISTNKNDKSPARGGPWAPKFRPFFKNAGLGMDKGPENIVNVVGHVGPHPSEYHKLVFDRLTRAVRGLKANTPEYKKTVVETLTNIAKEAQEVESKVNKLLTKK